MSIFSLYYFKKDKTTALMWACDIGNAELVKLLLLNGVNFGERNTVCVIIAITVVF